MVLRFRCSAATDRRWTRLPAANLLNVPPGELDRWQYQTDSTFLPTQRLPWARATGEVAVPAMPALFTPFQSHRAVRQTVALDSAEEWTVYNMNPVQHPFHIHINPVQVVKINGEPVEPFWADTVGLPRGGSPEAPTSIASVRVSRISPGCLSCIATSSRTEDMGMMQLVEVT